MNPILAYLPDLAGHAMCFTPPFTPPATPHPTMASAPPVTSPPVVLRVFPLMTRRPKVGYRWILAFNPGCLLCLESEVELREIFTNSSPVHGRLMGWGLIERCWLEFTVETDMGVYYLQVPHHMVSHGSHPLDPYLRMSTWLWPKLNKINHRLSLCPI